MSYLQEAFREAARREFAMIPDEEEIDYSFSPKFLRKMRGLLRAEAYGYWKYVNTAAKRVAIAAAITVILLTSAMAIKPVREYVIKFFIEVYEDYFEVTFGKETSGDLYADAEQMTVLTLSYLPDDYKTEERIISDTLIWTTWVDSRGSRISLKQEPSTQRVVIDNEDKHFIHHGGLTIMHYLLTDMNCYIWEQSGCIFTLSVHEECAMDTVLKMIFSLSPIKK